MKKDSREIYYIGIGKDIKRAYHTGSRSEIWKRYYAKYGLIVDILCNNIDLDSAKDIEKFLIAQYGKNQLCNRTDGGEGFLEANILKKPKELLKKKTLEKKQVQRH